MKGDHGGEIACPTCGKVRRARRSYRTAHGTTSIRRTLRAAIFAHIRSDHPGLGPREMSLLADRAVDAMESERSVRLGSAESTSASGTWG